MPAITRSQSNSLVAVENKSLNQLTDAMSILDGSFTDKRTIQQNKILSKFIDDTIGLIEPTIKDISTNVDIPSLHTMATLHNRVLDLGAKFEKGNIVTWFKSLHYTRTIVECFRKYIDKMVVEHNINNLQGCIYGYVQGGYLAIRI